MTDQLPVSKTDVAIRSEDLQAFLAGRAMVTTVEPDRLCSLLLFLYRSSASHCLRRWSRQHMRGPDSSYICPLKNC